MPVNVTHEYVQAEKQFHEAQTTNEKIAALKNMLAKAPTHKGAEKLRAELKTKLSKLRTELEKEKKRGKGKSLALKKEGAAQVVLVGPPNAGKSHCLGVLSESKVEEEPYKFSTKEPQIRMMNLIRIRSSKKLGLPQNVKTKIQVQLVEIPAIYAGFYDSKNGRQFFGVIRNAELCILILRPEGVEKEMKIIRTEFEKAGIKLTSDEKRHEGVSLFMPAIALANGPAVKGTGLKQLSIEQPLETLKDQIWKTLNLVAVQTKTKTVAQKPVVLKPTESTVEKLADTVHKDFLKKFKYARIWGPSAKFPGQTVGLEHKLKDGDIIELYMH